LKETLSVPSRRFEIHMHSCHSDGEYSPAGLVRLARNNGVSILSLTDHDTFSGLPEFLESAAEAGIEAFPGIEITVAYRDFNLHLLAYFRDLESIRPELNRRVEKMKQQREERMHELIARINEVVPERFRGAIRFENVQRASEGVLARPHLAAEMVRLGIVRDVREAFDEYLVEYNIEKKNLTAFEALRMVRESGGIPVLAHPGERTYSLVNPQKGRLPEHAPEMVAELKEHGLMGLECVYPYHEKTGQVDFFVNLARSFGLIVTGSRDFHGAPTNQKPALLGATPMEPAWLDRFREAWG